MAMNIETVLAGQVRWNVADNSETIAVSSNTLLPNYRKKIHYVSNHSDLYFIDSTGYSTGDIAIFLFADGTPCAVYSKKTGPTGTLKQISIVGVTADSYTNQIGMILMYSAELGLWIKL